jgi:MSHA biogenesis protein MshG
MRRRLGRSVSLEDRFLLIRQLHVLQKSGVPLLASLASLQSQMPSSALARILQAMQQDLLEGRTLSQAMGRYPGAFGAVEVALIRVGESGGLLTEVLQELARLLEWELDVRSRLSSALLYPFIVFVTLSGALAVLAVFVLPQFSRLFSSFHIQLPLATRLLVGLGQFLASYSVVLALAAAAVGAAGWAVLRTPAGRLQWHERKIRLPVLGPVFLQMAMSRASRVIAALNRSGVPILETLSLAAESVNNTYIRGRLDAVRAKVQGGAPLAAAMGAEPVFPAVVVQMVRSGEESGRLDELLHGVSEYYDQQVAYTLRHLITLIEPALLLVVGCGVLVMAVAVYLPMWDLVQIFKTTGR